MRNVLIILNIILIAGCGFHLRGHNAGEKSFPFTSLYVKFSAASPFIGELQNKLELNKIKMAASSAVADLTLEIVSERSSKQILALSGAGQVREFQLDYLVTFRAYDKQMQEWVSADEILLQRSLNYDDAQILAKEQEEQLLYRDMRSDAVQQVLRRLSRAKPRPDIDNKSQDPAPAGKPAYETQR